MTRPKYLSRGLAPTARLLPAVVAVAAAFAPAGSAQISTTNCNDTGRALDLAGGTTQTTVECPSATFTVTVGVVSFSITTPSSCPSSSTTYSGSVYRCEGTVEGSHCTAQGYKVPFKIYGFGAEAGKACPSPASLSFDSFAAAFAALGCQPPPLITDSFDWSASVSRRATANSIGNHEVHGAVITTAQGSAVVWDGDPAEHGATFVPQPLEAWLQSLPRIPAESLPMPVAIHRQLVPSLPAAEGIVADIEIVERVDGELRSRTLVAEGAVASDDRFDATLTHVAVAPDGDPATIVERYAYDGHSLRHAVQGAPRQQFFAADHPHVRSQFQTELHPLLALGQWVKDPIAYDRLGALTVSVAAPNADGLVRVMQDWGAVLPIGGRVVHWFDAAQAGLAVRSEYRDVGGALVRSRTYADPVEIAPDVFRPMTVVEEWWGASGELERRQTTRVRRAVPLFTSPEPGFGRFELPGARWLVHVD